MRGNDSFGNDVPLAAYSMANSTFGIVQFTDLVTVLGRWRCQIEIKDIPGTRTRDTIEVDLYKTLSEDKRFM